MTAIGCLRSKLTPFEPCLRVFVRVCLIPVWLWPCAVVRLDDVFSKTTAQPPLYYKVRSEEEVAAARAANEARGGPVFLSETDLQGYRRPAPRPAPFRQRNDRSDRALEREWGGVPRRR